MKEERKKERRKERKKERKKEKRKKERKKEKEENNNIEVFLMLVVFFSPKMGILNIL